MLVSYELTMPSVGSWNNKWSGESKCYTIVRAYRKKEDILKAKELVGNSFPYRWNDGWCALIHVEEVNSKEAKTLRKIYAGFCGYNWMIDSIWKHGEIKAGE